MTDANAAAAAERQDVALVVKGGLRAVEPAVREEEGWVGEDGGIEGGFAEGHADG